MTEKQLRSCEHETDITKTCRQIIKYMYRDPRERAKMLVSTMDTNVLKCIQGNISNYQLLITNFYFIRLCKTCTSSSSSYTKFDS